MRASLLSAAVALATMVTAGRASADEPVPAQPAARDEGPQMCDPEHWSNCAPRPFISLRLDAGYLYVKPRFSFGYGKPFSVWGGLDAVPLVTPDSAGGYTGLRLQIDWFELRAGARYVHAFVHQFLSPKPSYGLVDLAEDTGHPSEYVDLEAEMTAAIPAGPGNVLVTATVSSIQLVPAGFDVYDETLRVVVSPPGVYRGRLGYALHLLKERNLRLGLVGELLEIPDRHAQVYRAGIVATFDVDDHFQAVANILLPVVGPDSLGFLGADYTELGIRYRWATGHAHIPTDVSPGSEMASEMARNYR
jgi:hypothetical protein